MRRERDTQKLIEKFASQPGVEGESLDFKSREITETSQGRQKLVKVLGAMANQNGGTVIVGVRHDSDGGLLIQDFPTDSEVKQHLTHIALEYTSPPISDHWDISFLNHSGNQVLRIDVEPASERPVEYKQEGEFEPWIRIEDGMEQMSHDHIRAFYQEQQREADSIFSSKIRQQIDVALDIDSQEERTQIPAPDNWLITTVGKQDLIVCGEDGLQHDYGKAALFHVDCRIGKATADTIKEILDTAPIDLFPSRLAYTIKLGVRQSMARGENYFLDDLSNIESVIQVLQEAHNYGPPSNHSLSEDPRPIAVAYVSCPQGIFWLETQWRGAHFGRTKCGFVFTDLPFNDEQYQSFFKQYGEFRGAYEQRVGPQMITIRSQGQQLRNPLKGNTASHPGAYERLVVDNPYYGRIDEVRDASQRNLPDYLLEPLGRLNRFPLEIGGGYTPGSDDDVVLDRLTTFSKGLLQNTQFISGWCRKDT